MKILNIIFGLVFFTATYSCSKKIPSEKGGIDILSNVYFNASKNLNNVQNFHVSKLNYSHDSIVEFVPDLQIPTFTNAAFFIKDSLCYSIESSNELALSEIKKKQKPISVYSKKMGAIFSKDWIPNYHNRKNLSDTIIFKKKYKRFEVNSPWNYTRYYVYETDTILPYSLYKQAEVDYDGRIERIDSYNKKKDIFVSIQLIPRKNWDSEAKDFFEFNQFINKNKTKK